MKEILVNYFKRQKKILTSMGIVVLLFFIDITILLNLIISRQDAINSFLQKSEISSEIVPITLFSFIGMGLGIVFLWLLFIFFVKTFFPNRKSVDNLMMKDEIGFLLKIPSEIGKEIRKNGK